MKSLLGDEYPVKSLLSIQVAIAVVIIPHLRLLRARNFAIILCIVGLCINKFPCNCLASSFFKFCYLVHLQERLDQTTILVIMSTLKMII